METARWYQRWRRLKPGRKQWNLIVLVVIVLITVYGLAQGLRPAPVTTPAAPDAEPDQPQHNRPAVVSQPAPREVQPQVTPAPSLEVVPAPATPAPPAPAPAAGAEPAGGQVTMAWPLLGTVCREFGWSHSATFGDWRFHPGVDIGGAVGQLVRAAAPGRVKSVTEDAWFNLSVVIDHGGGLQTVYRNLGAVRVKEGAELDREQVFAELGTPGSAEVGDGGPRLHFEVRRGELALDPLQFLR